MEGTVAARNVTLLVRPSLHLVLNSHVPHVRFLERDLIEVDITKASRIDRHDVPPLHAGCWISRADVDVDAAARAEQMCGT